MISIPVVNITVNRKIILEKVKANSWIILGNLILIHILSNQYLTEFIPSNPGGYKCTRLLAPSSPAFWRADGVGERLESRTIQLLI